MKIQLSKGEVIGTTEWCLWDKVIKNLQFPLYILFFSYIFSRIKQEINVSLALKFEHERNGDWRLFWFLVQVKQFHPDVNKEGGDSDRMIRLVIQAYEVQSYIKLEQFISFDFFSKDSKEDTGPPWIW